MSLKLVEMVFACFTWTAHWNCYQISALIRLRHHCGPWSACLEPKGSRDPPTVRAEPSRATRMESRCSSVWHLDLIRTSYRHMNHSRPLCARTAHLPARAAVGNSQTDNHRWLPTDVWTFTLTIADYLTVPESGDTSATLRSLCVCVCVLLAWSKAKHLMELLRRRPQMSAFASAANPYWQLK